MKHDNVGTMSTVVMVALVRSVPAANGPTKFPRSPKILTIKAIVLKVTKSTFMEITSMNCLLVTLKTTWRTILWTESSRTVAGATEPIQLASYRMTHCKPIVCILLIVLLTFTVCFTSIVVTLKFCTLL